MRVDSLLLGATLALTLPLCGANAADLIYGDQSAPYTDSFGATESPDWTGGYVGAFGGLGSGDFGYDGTGNGRDVSGGGVLGGVQAGYDVQVGNVVVGGVADIALTDIEADVSIRETAGGVDTTTSATSRLKHLGTVRGRAGYAIGPVLAYGHGGLAYGKSETEASVVRQAGGTTQASIDTRESHTKYGYVLGAGVEYKATDNVSLQTEYGYHDLGEDRLVTAGGQRVNEEIDFHTVKAGINFRF